ncbi:hypothetical protein Bca52824_079867 [Brassica carinata]|uniref:Uncharacterized protein n=1 Tax=Brassica carinata TaxID=52824 RepID=A0A8X7Q0F6_BRACI|nr:hypothetical protein Bca52824_079867 [Brassica carinata]
MSLAEAQQRTLTQPFDLRLRLSPPEISQRQLHEQVGSNEEFYTGKSTEAAFSSFSSPTFFALGSFSGLEAFSRPDLLADEAETCGEEMKLNGEVELQVFLWFFSAQLPRFPFQASRSVGGSELHSLLLGAVRLVGPSSRF